MLFSSPTGSQTEVIYISPTEVLSGSLTEVFSGSPTEMFSSSPTESFFGSLVLQLRCSSVGKGKWLQTGRTDKIQRLYKMSSQNCGDALQVMLQ